MISKFVVIVCGGREYGMMKPPGKARGESAEAFEARSSKAENERASLVLTLNRLRPDMIYHGDASGADAYAQMWAERNGVDYVAYPANWNMGAAAGPKRNADMAADLLKDRKKGARIAVVAFPGGAGTQSMCNIAQRKGIEVIYSDEAFGSLVETTLAARQLSLETQRV